ncbi:MAG: mechanosensitive ion channel family protein [Fimbriimonadaceae bacterium]|nr:mechanosensitive ion channel family protein [Fimbriimonadaceae bacterium]
MRLLWMVLLSLATLAVWAQTPPAPPPAEPVDPAPAEIRSPRKALETWFEAVNDGDVERAMQVMDFSDIPAVTVPVEGPRLSLQLLAILNRIAKVPVERFSTREEGDPVIVVRMPSSGEPIRLVRGEDGGWRFSADTVSRIPEFLEEVRSRPVLSEFADQDEGILDPSDAIRAAVPTGLRRPLGALELWQWFGLAVLLTAGLAAVVLVRSLARGLLRLIFAQGIEFLSVRQRRKVGRALGFLAGAGVIRLLFPLLGLPPVILAWVLTLVNGLIALAAVLLLWTVWDSACEIYSRRLAGKNDQASRLLIPIIQRFGQLLIVLAVGFFLAGVFGINPAGLITGLGIGGAILALAAKDSVENFFGSVTVLFERPFVIGDWVKIGDAEGNVEDIGLRSTRIRTFADSLLVLPNRNLISHSIENFGRRRKRQLKLKIPIAPGADSAAIQAFLADCKADMESNSSIVHEDSHFVLNELSAQGAVVLVYAFLNSADYREELDSRERFLQQVLVRAQEHGLTIGLPLAPAP